MGVILPEAKCWLVSRCGTQSEPLQSRQDGFGKVWQFCEIVHKVERQTVETHSVQPGEFLGDRIWITNDTVGSARQGPPLYHVGPAASQQALRVGARAGVALVHVGEIS